MEPSKTAAQPPQQPQAKSRPWAQMTTGERIVYVAKVSVCVLTFGFVFPSISSD